MKCPVCKDVTLLMSEKRGVEIDYCPECRGIWLDRGELEKLMEVEERSSKSYDRDYERQSERNRKRDYDDYDDRKYSSKHTKRKKESIFGEIFDMFGD